MVDYQMHDLAAGGYHLTNVLLHAASVVLLFLILRRMTGTFWRSAFVAAIFAIHPLRVESVAWVAERKDVLCGFFFMVTLGAYVRYTRRPFSIVNYLAVLAGFTLGLLCKPGIVTLPFLLILLDYWPLRRFQNLCVRHLVLEKLPLLFLSVLASIGAVLAQDNAVISSDACSITNRIGNALDSYSIYLLQTVYPAGLVPYYPHHGGSPYLWQIILSLLVPGSVTMLALFLWKRRPYVAVGWLWFLGMLVPMIGFVQIGGFAHADRFTYLPQIGLLICFTWLVSDLAWEWKCQRMARGAGALLVLVLLPVTWKQTSFWHDSISLWSRTLECLPNNFLAHFELGQALVKEGREEEAMSHFRKGLEIFPGDAKAHNSLGDVLLHGGRADEAIFHFHQALELQPDYPEASFNLAAVLEKQGKSKEAELQYLRVLKAAPDSIAVRNNLAWICATSADPTVRNGSKAVEFATRACELSRWKDVNKMDTLAAAYAETGDFDQAVKWEGKYLESMPSDTEAQNRLVLYQNKQPFHQAAKF